MSVSDNARELVLFADNEKEIYDEYILPVCKMLSRKVKKGIYEQEKAVKAFGPTLVASAKLYVKRFNSPGTKYYKVFNKECRNIAANQIVYGWDYLIRDLAKGDF